MKRACIVPGLFEGYLSTWRMRRELRRRGYTIVKDLDSADVVIAHSGGHLLIDELRIDQLLLLIDPRFPNSRNPFYSTFLHVFYDSRYVLLSNAWLFYIEKSFVNFIYIFVGLPQTIQLARQWRVNKHNFDYWRKRPNTLMTFSSDTSWGENPNVNEKNVYYFKTDHDNCWYEPCRYLDLLQY